MCRTAPAAPLAHPAAARARPRPFFAPLEPALAFALLFLAGCSAGGVTATPPAGCTVSPETRQLAAEFRRLRAEKGHWQGGAWSDDLDGWMGARHRAMIEVGSRLGGGDCLRTQVEELLGPPDEVAGPGNPLFEQAAGQHDFQKPPAPGYELLVYEWRGPHDFLYLTAAGQTVYASGWWHAYE